MRVVVFGASGMVGRGVVRECVLADDVERVVVVGRSPSAESHAKLHDVVHADFSDFTAIEPELAGCDACFFCLGVTSSGRSETDYTRITYDTTIAAARAFVRASPSSVFVYVSGAGTDSTETKRSMWARVKGKTENALLAMPFRAAYMFRPALIQPRHGIVSRTPSYRIFYVLAWPLLPLLRAFPSLTTTTDRVGRAMLACVRTGAPRAIVTSRDINALAKATLASATTT
jgi:uncharacterized protein YbjT (DUF2867 family)